MLNNLNHWKDSKFLCITDFRKINLKVIGLNKIRAVVLRTEPLIKKI